MKNKIDIIELGIMDYVQVYNLQKELLQKRKQDQIPDTLIVVEHPHTITYGRLAKQQNILVSEKILKEKKIPVYKIDRGGDFTYHGPGQIVAYPIINLKNYNLDLKGYFEFLENIIIDFLKSYGIISCRGVKHRGVWVGCNKIAAMGIGVSRWVAYHGIAVNINTDLEYFSLIKPCGLDSLNVTSLKKLSGVEIDISKAKSRFIASFKKVFYGQKKERSNKLSFMVDKETVTG